MDESAEIKSAILTAATDVFTTKGYRQTTLAEVAERVGLTRPGILHHFGSKDALFRAVLDRLHEWATGQAGTVPTSLRELTPFVGGPAETRRPLQLMQVLEGESISGNETAQQFVAERVTAIRTEIRRRLVAARATVKHISTPMSMSRPP